MLGTSNTRSNKVGGTADEGAEATWAYNLNGQVTNIIDGNGNRAELHYDRHGRQDRWTFPSTTRPASYNDTTQATALASAGAVNAADYEQYGYDANGNRTSLRKRDNAAYVYGDIVYEYDALNRVTRKTVPERAEPHPAPLAAALTRDVFYGYDLRNLQLYARFDSQSGEGITNAYDGFGRVSSSSSTMGGTTRTLSYAYNAHGARTQITHPDGISFGTLYDGFDRPYYVYDTVSAPIAYYTYTPFGALDHSGHGGWTFYAYDGLQRPSVRYHDFHGGAGAVLWTYGYNAAGGLGSVTRDNDAFAWTRHHAANRTYATNGLNQYSLVGSGQGNANYTYDANGNLTSDGTLTYGYDIENRLVSSSEGAALVYDPLGRLYRVSDATHDTRFVYDGDALVVEYGADGTVQRRHVHGAGADTPMITYEGTNLSTPNNLFADHQGSIIAHANGSGATVAVNTYDEYGIPGAANAGRFQYTGQAWLAELGMYYYKARIYSPTFGRFLQTDPVGYDDQINLYAYVGNDPVNATDPSGKQSCPRGAGPNDCPDIPPTPRAVRQSLERDVRRSRGDGERGGQALRNNQTGQITNRTGSEAGRGNEEEFQHYSAPEGHSTVLRSHTHKGPNNNERGLEAGGRRTGQNAPSEADQRAMHGSRPGQGRPVQTIGPDVTTTMFRRNRQDYLVVDSGNRHKIPDLRAQQIIVCPTDECP